MSEDRRRIVAWVAAQVMPHEGAVRTWLRGRQVPADEADDLVQEAYARLAALTSVEQIARPDGYFFQIVRNLMTEKLRRSRIVRFETVSQMDDLGLRDETPSPEQATAARRELARVRTLIDRLPDRCRRIFILRKIEGVPQREIARRLGVSEGVIENEGAKGLRLILQALRDDEARGPAGAKGQRSSRKRDGRARNR